MGWQGSVTGRARATLHYNYYLHPEDTFWKNIDYSQYDLISFSVFPGCDLPTTEDYIDAQLSHYLDIVRANDIPWVLAELTIQESYFNACGISGDAYLALKDDVLQVVWDKVDQVDPQPVGVQVRADSQGDEPAEFVNTLNAYLDAH